MSTYKIHTFVVPFDLTKNHITNLNCPSCKADIKIQTECRREKTDKELIDDLKKTASLKGILYGACFVIFLICFIPSLAIVMNKGKISPIGAVTSCWPLDLTITFVFLLCIIKPLSRVISARKQLTDIENHLQKIGNARNVPYRLTISPIDWSHYIYDISGLEPNPGNVEQFYKREWWNLPKQSSPINL
jgi:hypothetical protein